MKLPLWGSTEVSKNYIGGDDQKSLAIPALESEHD